MAEQKMCKFTAKLVTHVPPRKLQDDIRSQRCADEMFPESDLGTSFSRYREAYPVPIIKTETACRKAGSGIYIQTSDAISDKV